MYKWILISIAMSVLHTALVFLIENETFRFIAYVLTLIAVGICTAFIFIEEIKLNKRIEKLEKFKGE